MRSETISKLKIAYAEMLSELDDAELELIDVHNVFTLPDAFAEMGRKLKKGS